MNIDNKILKIKQVCISAKAFKLNGNNLRSIERQFEAKRLMFDIRYRVEYKNTVPDALKFFPFFVIAWNERVDNDLAQCLIDIFE